VSLHVMVGMIMPRTWLWRATASSAIRNPAHWVFVGIYGIDLVSPGVLPHQDLPSLFTELPACPRQNAIQSHQDIVVLPRLARTKNKHTSPREMDSDACTALPVA
jgi:hypothetical protein